MNYCKNCDKEYIKSKFEVCNDCAEGFSPQVCFDRKRIKIDLVDEIDENSINDRLKFGFALLQED